MRRSAERREMGWFGGVVTTTSCPIIRPVSPTWSRELPHGELWTLGTKTRIAVTTTDVGLLQGAVLGSHTVTADHLQRWLSKDWRHGPPAWPGTYAVVVFHPEGATVFTDPAHALPLYFCEVEGAVVWASSSRALSGLTSGGVDLAWVADLLTEPAGRRNTERSAFYRVHTIPPGHRMNVRKGEHVTIDRWWSPPPASTPWMDAAQLLRKALEEAVTVRLMQSEHLSCDLSGGLDSSTLCLLASEQATGTFPLTAWTVHPASKDHGGDLDYARDVAHGRPDVKHVLLSLSEEELPYSSLAQVPPTDEPAPTTITSARHVFAYEKIHTTGSTLHMTGDGGDALLMQSPELIPRLVTRGHALRALRDLHGWAKLDRGSPLRLLSRLLRGERETSYRWLTPKAHRIATSKHGQSVVELLRDDAELFSLREIGRTAHADTQFAAFFRVRLESPFLDRAVVEAALAFRVGARGSPWSYKPQLTEAMRGLLPETIARRRTKGGTDADHHLGLRAHLQEVSTLLDGWLAGHGLIDPHVVREELRTAASGRDTPWGLLEPVVATEVWGRAVEANPVPSWVRAQGRQGVGG